MAQKLEKDNSYIRKGAEWLPNPAWGIVKLYKIAKGMFPAGLMSKVCNIFDSLGVSYVLVNDDEKIAIDSEKFKLLSSKLRDYQKDAILQLILNNGGQLVLPTGAGKTFTAIEFLKYLNKRTLVITTTLDIMNQWKKQVPDFVDVLNYHKILKDTNMLKNYDVFVTDESHHVSSKTIYNIAMKCGNGILVGLSATPYRDDFETPKIEAALGKIVYQIDRRSLIDKGYLADADVFVIDYNNHTNSKFLSYQEIYKDFIVNNVERNDKILKIVKKESNRKILILVVEIEHGENIRKLLLDNKIDCKFLHGEIKERNVEKTDNVLIATGIFDEGVDIPHFDVLILAGGGKSSIKVIQRVGRVLRMTPGKRATIYDFIDRSRYLYKHYKIRKEILEQDFKVYNYSEIL